MEHMNENQIPGFYLLGYETHKGNLKKMKEASIIRKIEKMIYFIPLIRKERH